MENSLIMCFYGFSSVKCGTSRCILPVSRRKQNEVDDFSKSTSRLKSTNRDSSNVAVYRVLYQSILNAKLTGRKEDFGREHKQQGWLQAWRISVKQADSNTCWELHKEVDWSWSQCIKSPPRSDVFRKRATKPLLNQRQSSEASYLAVEKKNWTVAQWSKVLFSDES